MAGLAEEFIRILSDLHYGERSSRVRSLGQLRPLAEGPAGLVLNGDTLDTRPGSDPEHNRRSLAEVRAYFGSIGPPVTFLTGNHDPDISPTHFLDLAGGEVFATHGDILFEDIVPWGRDAAIIRQRLQAAFASGAPAAHRSLEDRLLVYRQVAASIGQRHQAEHRGLYYALRMAADSIWPPWRILRVLHAWRVLPERAAALARQHRPRAKFCLVGHTHRPGVWRTRSGVIVIDTGAFCIPFAGLAVDVARDRLTVRRIASRRGEFYPGAAVAEFRLEGKS
jgi:predicted phosphodiesterase